METGFAINDEISRQMIENARDVFLLVESDTGSILFCNQAAVEFYGYTKNELNGMKIFELRSEDSRNDVRVQMGIARQKGVQFETKHQKRNGSIVPVEVSSISIGGSEEKLLLSIIRDISERKARESELSLKEKELAEKYEELSVLYEELMASEEELKGNYRHIEKLKEEAERANEYKSMFLSNMSHEIRTPLNGLLGMSELLEASELNQTQRDYCRLMKISGEHLLRIINDVLDISKIESGKLQLSEAPFSLKKSLESLLSTFYKVAEDKGIELICYYQPFLDEMFIGDELRINQILLNLISNAFKFTNKGQIQVKIKSRERSENRMKLLCSVSDTGTGINQELSRRIFSMFEQGDISYTKKYGGTGLGLSICRRLAEIMGGEIWYESVEGEGSIFYFTLDLKRVRPQTAKEGKEEVIASTDPGKRLEAGDIFLSTSPQILVAEDNEINRVLVSSYLRKKGYSHICVENGQMAVQAYKERKVDLILMDIQMPVMNGFDAAKEIRRLDASSDAGRHTCIIAMTAYAMESEMDVCLRSGMDDYISKPLKKEEFYKKISQYLKGSGRQ